MPLITYTSPSEKNIIVGAARLYMDGEYLGYTQGGVTVTKTNDWLDVPADQAGGKLKKVRTLETMTLKTTLLEATRAIMAKCLNEPSGNTVAGSMTILGDVNLTTSEHTFKTIGPAPNGQWRIMEFFRGVIIGDIEYTAARDAVSSIPFEVELLKDPANNQAFGATWDQTAQPTF